RVGGSVHLDLRYRRAHRRRRVDHGEVELSMSNEEDVTRSTMAHDDSKGVEKAYTPSSGLAVSIDDPVENPGLPPHRARPTDKDPKAAKRAGRTIYTLFYLSVAASIWAVAAYMLFPIEDMEFTSIRQNNLFIGLGIAFALLAIGVGAIHWSKTLMSDKEHV